MRVLLVNMPKLLGELIRELLDSDEIAVVGELTDPRDLLRAASGAGADAVIMRDTTSALSSFGTADAEIRVLTLVGDREHGTLYRWVATSEPIGALSRATLIAAVKGLA